MREVYSLVDAHMSDSVSHNKGFSEVLQEMYDLEKPAGQIFCGSHTTLGFAAAMNKKLRHLEAEMKMEEVMKTFMVDLEVTPRMPAWQRRPLIFVSIWLPLSSRTSLGIAMISSCCS